MNMNQRESFGPRFQADRDALSPNRTYKDTIFRLLFSEKKALLSLYNAVNGALYEDPEELIVVTLRNAVYMVRENELAFFPDARF